MPVGVRVGAAPLPRPALHSHDGLRRLATSLPWQVCLLTLIAAALRFPRLGAVALNPFYDAAVRSMAASGHNFLFGAFDPGAILAIDKPPLDLWLQVGAVKLFGWSSVALKLPEAMAGTLAVPLLYDTVRRVAGSPAGFVAAAALAVLPESVLTSRSDTMDSVMMLLAIAALWLTLRAAARADRRLLLLAGVTLGFAFNVKLLEALLPLPALALFYWLAAPASGTRRLADLALAAGALVVVGLSWAVIVSLLPGHHPWAIGSTDGSVWNAMFVFNGLGKVGGAPLTEPGGPGPLRLLVSTGWHSDAVFGCALLSALALGAAAVVSSLRAGPRPLLRRRDLPFAFWVACGTWLVLGVIAFDLMRTVHARYLEALAPAVAMTIGGSTVALAGLRRRAPALGLTFAALAAIGAYTFHFKPAALGWSVIALIVAFGGAALLAHDRGLLSFGGRWLLAGIIATAALVFPAHESLTLVRRSANDSGGLAALDQSTTTALSRYLTPRTRGLRYELIADEPVALAPLIVRDGRDILPLTSFGGRPLTSLSTLLDEIRRGQARYWLTGGVGCTAASHYAGAACGPAARWVRRYGSDVTPPGVRGRRLYQLPVASAR